LAASKFLRGFSSEEDGIVMGIFFLPILVDRFFCFVIVVLTARPGFAGEGSPLFDLGVKPSCNLLASSILSKGWCLPTELRCLSSL
jgi:hypothetical protein